jgi:hypothetical protein
VASHPRPVEGIRIALELYGLAEALLRQRLVRDRPELSPAAIEDEVTGYARGRDLAASWRRLVAAT